MHQWAKRLEILPICYVPALWQNWQNGSAINSRAKQSKRQQLATIQLRKAGAFVAR
jgi:hypothetical protein